MNTLRLTLPTLALALAIPLAFSLPAHAGTTVHSLDQVKGAIHNKAGKDNFQAQINGDPLPPDNLGTRLPAGLSRATVASLIAPGQDLKLATLIGAKRWPHRANSYVTIACFATRADDYDLKDADKNPRCDGGDRQVFLGVIEYRGSGTPTLVARYPRALDIATRWNHTKINGPVQIDKPDDEVPPNTWSRFDLAPYQLRDSDYALGLRAGFNEGYAGGGAYFETLQLFLVEGSTLKAVFAEPMYFQGNYAGNWHEDGTRDHTEEEATNILTILPATSAGYHKLLVKSSHGRWHQGFSWSAKSGRYEAQ